MEPARFFPDLAVCPYGGGLISGFPRGLCLAGAAILTVALAGLSGYVFAGDPIAYFAIGGDRFNSFSSGVSNMLGAFLWGG